jgi:hypothetical protein
MRSAPGYETSIWTVATSGAEAPVRLTNGKHKP